MARDAGIGSQPISGRFGTRENTGNDSDTQTVTSNTDGILEFTGAVANSPQHITIDTTGTNAQAVNVTVQPSFDGEFIGTIPIVESGYSFKVTSTILNSSDGYQYGNNYDTYGLVLEVKNIGNADCETSTYIVSSEDPKLHFVDGYIDLPESGPVSIGKPEGMFLTIEPGHSKHIYCLAEYGQLDEEYVDATLKISITDSNLLNPRTWEDYAVIRFYRGPVQLNITAGNLENRSEAELKGFLMCPDGRSQHFSIPCNTKDTVFMPWSTEPYGLVFSGADADTEMTYIFALETEVDLEDLQVSWDPYINLYEPNNSENTKTPIEVPQTPVKSYLKKGDIDYFEINVSSAPLASPTIIRLDAYQFSDSDNGNGDNQADPGETLYMDMRIQNISKIDRDITVSLSSTSNYIDFVADRDSRNYGRIPAGHYQSLSAAESSSSASEVGLAPSEWMFVFKISENTPVGTKIPVDIEFSDDQGNSWFDGFNIYIED